MTLFAKREKSQKKNHRRRGATMSLSIKLVKDAETYYDNIGGAYIIPFGSTYTVDVLFHGHFADDDDRIRIGLKVDGTSVGYTYTVKKTTPMVDGARRVSFNGTNTNLEGTEAVGRMRSG